MNPAGPKADPLAIGKVTKHASLGPVLLSFEKRSGSARCDDQSMFDIDFCSAGEASDLSDNRLL